MDPRIDDTTLFLQTYTGRRVNPRMLSARDVCAEDIAHALSLICRWGGHAIRPYSVGQHSLNVMSTLPPKDQLAGLLHDATEAYMGDLVRPLKLFLPDYVKWEAWNRQIIFNHFGVKDYDWDNVVLEDNRWLMSEAHILIEGPKNDWREPQWVGYTADRWLHEKADPAAIEHFFLAELFRLTPWGFNRAA